MSLSPAPVPRPIGSVNWLGLQVLTCKEIERFLKVYAQTIIAPVMTSMLFYVVFAFALGGAQRSIGDVPYLRFLAPGLIMMSMAQNAFANSASSLVISKVQGNIVDVLMPPLSALELTFGYTVGGIVRGLVVIGGIWAEKFDQMAAVQNFIVMPATFLSGTFYTADRLPEGWRFLCHLNPFFYMIDGFRYGFIGVSDGTLHLGLVVLAAVNAVLLSVAYRLISTGYKLKS